MNEKTPDYLALDTGDLFRPSDAFESMVLRRYLTRDGGAAEDRAKLEACRQYQDKWGTAELLAVLSRVDPLPASLSPLYDELAESAEAAALQATVEVVDIEPATSGR